MASKGKRKKSVRERMIARAHRRLANLARKQAKIRKDYKQTVGVVNDEIAEQTEVLRVLTPSPSRRAASKTVRAIASLGKKARGK